MIGYYIHHQGSGHLARAQAVAAHLRTPVTGLSSLARPGGWVGDWLQLDRDDEPPPSGAQPRDVDAGGVLHWAPAHQRGLSARMAAVAAWVERVAPAVVVVDVSVEVALLVRLCGIPVVVLAMPGERTDRPHRAAYDLAAGLLAPWPDGAHTGGWPQEWTGKLWTVGGFSRFDGLTLPQVPSSPPGARKVLSLWGSGGSQVGPDELAAAVRATPGWRWTHRGPDDPSPDLWLELADADVVVTHAGQNAVADVAAARRPAVVVAQRRPHGEQEATARAVGRLGCAVGVPRWPEVGHWPELLERAHVLGGDGWSRWSSGRGAADAALRLDRLADTEGAFAPGAPASHE